MCCPPPPPKCLLPLFPYKEARPRGKSSPPLASAFHLTRARTTWGKRQTISTSTWMIWTLLMRGTTSTTRTMKWTGKVGYSEHSQYQTDPTIGLDHPDPGGGEMFQNINNLHCSFPGVSSLHVFVCITSAKGAYVSFAIHFFVDWFVWQKRENLVQGCLIGQGRIHYILVWIWSKGRLQDSFFYSFSVR